MRRFLRVRMPCDGVAGDLVLDIPYYAGRFVLRTDNGVTLIDVDLAGARELAKRPGIALVEQEDA